MTIKDSGTRRQFESGAVRDMQEGKGRCDLLPACAILRVARHFEAGAKKYDDRNWEKGIPVGSFIDSAIRHLMKYLDGQADEDHLCAAGWNILCAMWTEEKRPDLVNIPTRPEYKTEGEREAYEAMSEQIRKAEAWEIYKEKYLESALEYLGNMNTRKEGSIEATPEGYIFRDANGVECARFFSDGGYVKIEETETHEETVSLLPEFVINAIDIAKITDVDATEMIPEEAYIGEDGELHILYKERTKL